MNISIRNRIYLSFLVIVMIFVVSSAITIKVVNGNKELSSNISTVMDPTLQGLHDFRNILQQSQMLSTNWVFIPSGQKDKTALKNLHDYDYPQFKQRMETLALKWQDQTLTDSIHAMFSHFEQLVECEEIIMASLASFNDYQDPVKKFYAEEQLETIVLPGTATIIAKLQATTDMIQKARQQQNIQLEVSTLFLQTIIAVLSITIICFGVFLSFYMSKIILTPIRHIRYIIHDLGKGITGKVNLKEQSNEIGEMVRSVNVLSDKLQSAATFAQQVGNRNFEIAFEPLSEKDTLGIALITMRDKLRITDENLREVQHTARLGSWERYIKSNTIVWSEEMFNIFDMDPLEFDHRHSTYLDLIHPEDVEFVKKLASKYLEDHQPISYQCRIITKKKVEKVIYAKGQVVLNEKGEVEKTFGIVQDITARKHAESALMASEYRLRTILNSTPECVKLLASDGTLLEMNPAGLAMIEADDAEMIIGKKVENLVEELYRSDFIKLTQQVFKGISGKLEFEITGLKGTKRWLATHAVPLKDSNGKVISMLGLTRDITQNKKAEMKLIQSEKHSRNLFEQSTVGLVLAHMDGTLADVNEAYTKIIGYSKEEAMQLTYWEITPEKYVEIEKEKLEELKQHGRYSSYEKEYMRKDGQLIPVRMSGIIIEKGDEKYILSSVEDITETRKAHESLLRKNTELQKTNAELDKFVYSVSHDLRAPLTSMLGVIEISQEETAEPQMIEHLDMLNSGIKKLDGFILDILDYSRNARTEIRKSEVDFRQMVDEIVKDLKYMGANEKVTDIYTEFHGSGRFVTDKSRISVVLNNLISNGLRYRNPDTDSSYVKIYVETNADFALIKVSDNGLGIRKEYHEKIFEMFYRVSENSVGSGLGLYIVKETVEKLNGTINIESEPGKGTTFTLNLPNNL